MDVEIDEQGRVTISKAGWSLVDRILKGAITTTEVSEFATLLNEASRTIPEINQVKEVPMDALPGASTRATFIEGQQAKQTHYTPESSAGPDGNTTLTLMAWGVSQAEVNNLATKYGWFAVNRKVQWVLATAQRQPVSSPRGLFMSLIAKEQQIAAKK